MVCRAAANTRLDDWRDTTRDRDLPVKFYLPAELDRPAPVIVFSPGVGGSREGYAYLGQAWAAHGYVVLVLEHVGSNESLFRPGSTMTMKQALSESEFVARAKDVRFAVDRLAQINADANDVLHGKLDLARLAIAGHSYGAQTVQAIVGEKIPAELSANLADPRFACGILMSPAPPWLANEPHHPFSRINLPLLHLTGTKDDSTLNNICAADRRKPFDQIEAGQQILVTFKDAKHMAFSGRHETVPETEKLNAELRPMIEEISTRFLDAKLRKQPEAEAWLKTHLTDAVGPLGTVEMK